MTAKSTTQLVTGPRRGGTLKRADVRKAVKEVYKELGIPPLWGGGKPDKVPKAKKK